MILVLNKDQLGAQDKGQLRATTPSTPIQILAWDKLGTNVSPEREQVLYQETPCGPQLYYQPQEPKDITCNFVLCHRRGSMIKINQFKSIILPERRVQTFFHQLPHTIPSDCTGTWSLKQRKEEANHWENPFWWPFAITLLKISVKLCLQTSLVTLGKLRHFFKLSFPTADVRTMVHQYLPGVQWWQLQTWLKACKTHEFSHTNTQISKTKGILYQYLKLL